MKLAIHFGTVLTFPQYTLDHSRDSYRIGAMGCLHVTYKKIKMDSQYLALLEETLQQTFGPSTVKQATARLSDDLYKKPLALPLLLHILQSTQLEQLKQLAAVEARKLTYTHWEKLDAAMRTQIRDVVLQNAFSQPSKTVRHSLARVVAAIAETDEQPWDSLLPTLVKAVQEQEGQTRETAVFALYVLLDLLNPMLAQHQDSFVDLFAGLLGDVSTEIRVNAVMLLDMVSQFLEEECTPQTAAKFRGCIPGMVQVLEQVIAADDGELVRAVFNSLNSLILLDNKLIGDHLVDLTQYVARAAENAAVDAEYRCMALLFLLSVVSLRKSKVVSANLGPQLTQVAVKVALEHVDVEGLLENDDEENENEESEPPTLALRLVAALLGELPPSQVIVPLLEGLPGMAASGDLFVRRAALLCVGVASSGAPDYVASQLARILPFLLNGLRDGELVVKVAAVRAVAQLTLELQDTLAEYHEQLLPLVIDIINTATHVVAYKHACYALDGIVEFMSHDAIAQYVQPLTQKLFAMLADANDSLLKLAIVSTIGSTAFALGKGFTPYFEQLIQVLEPFVLNPTNVEGMSLDDIELRAVTFENISTLARAVGSQSFSKYAKPLVEAAYVSLQLEHLRIRESGFAFISNMAKVYGLEFAGFLDQLVPLILQCLEQEEISLDADEEDELEQFKVNTGVTIEKEMAAVALEELAMGTGAAFAKYVESSFKVLNEQIDISYGMREHALSCLWRIVHGMFRATHGDNFKAPRGVPLALYVDPSILALIEQARAKTLTNLEEEFELGAVAADLDSLGEALQKFGPVAVISSASDTEPLERLCVQLLHLLKKEHQLQMDDEEPVDELEDASETEALLFELALEVVILLALVLGADFLKLFAPFKAVIAANVTLRSKSKRVLAIGALAEISLGLKQHNPDAQEFMQIFSDRLANDKLLEVKGNAAYGIGIVVESSSTDFSGSYQHILQMLFHLLAKLDEQSKVNDEDSRDAVHRATANACGCVARMALRNGAAIPLEHVLPTLLNHLPLESAPEENVPILLWIVALFLANDNLIVQHTEQVVAILAKIFAKEADRIKLGQELSLGREEHLVKMKQFQTEKLKEDVVGLVKYLHQKNPSLVSQHDILKAVIA